MEVLDVRVTAQKPEQFVNDGFEVQLLRGEHGKTPAQIEPRLRTKDGIRAGPRAVALEFSLFKHVPQQIEILNHRVKNLTAKCAREKKFSCTKNNNDEIFLRCAAVAPPICCHA
jgi:hypothetical protein